MFQYNCIMLRYLYSQLRLGSFSYLSFFQYHCFMPRYVYSQLRLSSLSYLSSFNLSSSFSLPVTEDLSIRTLTGFAI